MASSKSLSLVSNIKGGTPPPHTWDYIARDIRKPPNDPYITNTKVLQENEVIVPGDPADKPMKITTTMDNVIHYNLNMDTGTGGYEKNTAIHFDRFYSIYPEHEMTGLCQYVFFVKPDLNILKNGSHTLISLDSERARYSQNTSPNNDQFLRYMNARHPYVLANLSGNRIANHDFMPILTGRVESISLPDYKIKDYKMTQPYSGYNLPYASHALESSTGGEFEVVFRDDDDMRILLLFQTWLYYIDAVTRNHFAPKMKYIRNNRADYCTSIYVITCKPEGSEIVHWMKYTGAFPTVAPHSNLSFNLRGGANNKVTINFDYFHQEPLNPLSIVDFNKNANIKKNAARISYIPVYNSEKISVLGMKDKRSKTQKFAGANNTKFNTKAPIAFGTGNGLAGCPFICREGKKYYLRWKKLNLSPR